MRSLVTMESSCGLLLLSILLCVLCSFRTVAGIRCAVGYFETDYDGNFCPTGLCSTRKIASASTTNDIYTMKCEAADSQSDNTRLFSSQAGIFLCNSSDYCNVGQQALQRNQLVRSTRKPVRCFRGTLVNWLDTECSQGYCVQSVSECNAKRIVYSLACAEQCPKNVRCGRCNDSDNCHLKKVLPGNEIQTQLHCLNNKLPQLARRSRAPPPNYSTSPTLPAMKITPPPPTETTRRPAPTKAKSTTPSNAITDKAPTTTSTKSATTAAPRRVKCASGYFHTRYHGKPCPSDTCSVFAPQKMKDRRSLKCETGMHQSQYEARRNRNSKPMMCSHAHFCNVGFNGKTAHKKPGENVKCFDGYLTNELDTECPHYCRQYLYRVDAYGFGYKFDCAESCGDELICNLCNDSDNCHVLNGPLNKNISSPWDSVYDSV